MKNLNGTEKQIKWAEDLRNAFVNDADKSDHWRLTDLEHIVNALNAHLAKRDEPTFRNLEEAVESVKAYVVDNQTEAKWWIETRRKGDDAVLAEWAKSLNK